jgi:hypothetical protein
MGAFGTAPLPLYFAQSLRNRDFMLVPVVRAAIWPAQMGAGWGEVLSTFRSGSFDKDIGRALQQLFLALVFLTLWSMPPATIGCPAQNKVLPPSPEFGH